jgi:hypothetical protein
MALHKNLPKVIFYYDLSCIFAIAALMIFVAKIK